MGGCLEETHHCDEALLQRKAEEPGCGRSELPPAALGRDSSQRHVPSRNNRGKVKQIAHQQVRGVASLPDTSSLLASSNQRRSGVVVYDRLKCDVSPSPWRDALWLGPPDLGLFRCQPCLGRWSRCSPAAHSAPAVAGSSRTGSMLPPVCSVSCRLFPKRKGHGGRRQTGCQRQEGSRSPAQISD